MEQILETFCESFNQNSHISALFKNEPLTVCFEVFEDGYCLLFVNNNATVLKQTNLEDTNECVKIKGSKKMITDLLEGKQKLRDGISRQNLVVSTTFRKILLLESVFYLLNHGKHTDLVGKNSGILLT